jgi:myo-inositol-1(or 4)-monophosphatase
VADRVAEVLATVTDWGPSGRRTGQYSADLLADDAALGPLGAAGLDVLSEESGHTASGRSLLAIVDPLDGSTNASRGIPWFATSICVLDDEGPLVGLVADQSGAMRGTTGPRWWAVRGAGAFRDGAPITPSTAASLDAAIVGLSGMPPHYLGWSQFRALGAVALDLCQVADGTLDGYIDCSLDAHGSWDHAAASLICTEAGAVVADAFDRDLVPRGHDDRRTPIAAGTADLLAAIRTARRWT